LGEKISPMAIPQKLAVKPQWEGKRLPSGGKLLKGAEITHAEAVRLSNAGYKQCFKLVDADKHPNPLERIPVYKATAGDGVTGISLTSKTDQGIDAVAVQIEPKPEAKSKKPAGREELVENKDAE